MAFDGRSKIGLGLLAKEPFCPGGEMGPITMHDQDRPLRSVFKPCLAPEWQAVA